MQGGFLEDNGRDNSSNSKIKERGGLTPITTKIFKDSIINQDEGVEYMGVNISDVSIVGYLLDYAESDTKVKVKIWDHTGTVDIVFYNKNESEIHSGLANFYYTG
jgi:hypothetical protein